HCAGHVAASDEENVLESIHAASAQSSVIFAAPAYASGHCSEFASTSCFLKTNSEARVIFRNSDFEACGGPISGPESRLPKKRLAYWRRIGKRAGMWRRQASPAAS